MALSAMALGSCTFSSICFLNLAGEHMEWSINCNGEGRISSTAKLARGNLRQGLLLSGFGRTQMGPTLGTFPLKSGAFFSSHAGFLELRQEMAAHLLGVEFEEGSTSFEVGDEHFP